ncbi:CHAT domain-containing tetratricopeptide repeat protein [Parasphingorhabdus sp.]|uniref:CHAT domain-containing tetratricopeptide repeat protein n=1 Tax=Parasphingorhabdus sp. TaxID=2709688 RepID=UPI00300394E7
MSKFIATTFHQNGKPRLKIVRRVKKNYRLLLIFAAVGLFPAAAMAQNISAEAEATRSLADTEKLQRADQLWQDGNDLVDAGKLREAESLFAIELNLTREILGEKHPDTLDSLINYASILKALGRFSDAEPLLAEALQLRRELLGPVHPLTLISLNNYALVLENLGRSAEAEPLYAEALRLNRETVGEKHPSTITSLNNYAGVLENLGRAGEAEPLYAKAVRLNREVLGDRHPDTLSSLGNHAFVLDEMGRASEAEALQAEALRLKREILGENHPSTLTSLNNYALLLENLGRANEAEPLFAEALRLNREVLGAKHPDTLKSLNNYASVLDNLGRAREAEPPHAEALRLRREVQGPNHPDTLISLNNYALVLEKLDRAKEAEPRYAEALRLNREILGTRHPSTITSQSNYAGVLKELGRAGEAEPLYAEVLRLRQEVLGRHHPDTLISMNNYAYILTILGRSSEAEPLYAETLELRRKLLGENHPETTIAKANLAHVRLALPSRSHLAVAPARSLLTDIRAVRAVAGFTPSEEAQLGRAEKSQSDQFRLFANAAWARGPGLAAEARAAGAKPLASAQDAALREEVLLALQDALAGAAGKAIAANVARKAAGPLEPLAVERENLSQQWLATDKALIKTLGESGAVIDDRRNNLRIELAGLKRRMKAIDDRLQKEAPEYFSLIRPEALALSAAQEVLASDEAALMVVPTRSGTHIMLVSDEGLRWVRSDWASDKIDAAVKRLFWDVGAHVDVSAAESAEWTDEGQGAYPFAFDTSYALYRELIAPIAEGLKGKKHLFISASGSLSSMPFGMLASGVPAGDNGDPDVLRSARWFADAHALILIPTLQSLEFLRKYRTAAGQGDDLSFMGIGDPVLSGRSHTRGSRSKDSIPGSSGTFKSLFDTVPAAGEANIANISQLMRMARLPGTATELTAMWEEFGKPADALYLAEKATEHFIRTANLDANIIVFATHGLLAGDIGGIAEPGIVLTPPSQASESDDGYLSASEISALKLNADWVILSACNTAAGDGSEGAPGLSGLARSFFYAGAKNLLASHWPVRDDVAAKLTVRIISIAKDNPQQSRAQSFQQAMREIRNDKSADSDTDTWAHPNAWAPFSLIGDGAH